MKTNNLILELHIMEFDTSMICIIEQQIQKIFKKNNIDCSIKFLSHEQYWDNKKKDQCFFLIKMEKELSQKQLAHYFNISLQFNTEEAYWRNDNKSEMLLHSNITQAYIYKENNPLSKKLCFVILIHVDFSDPTIEKVISENLSLSVKSSSSTLYPEFLSSNQYWKYPQTTEYFWSIFSNENPPLEDVLKLFHVSFQKLSADQGAVWAQHVCGGIFLHENVKWVNIFPPVEDAIELGEEL